ncbi:MAG: adenylate kinase [Acidobacteria bacterium]|nr:adenylate kinase [Acidobacteriota bacterium]
MLEINVMALKVIVLGPPGAGKGTQAERLARECGIPKISTGEIIREAVQVGSELGRAAKATLEAGRLVGDDIMIGIVRERLARENARRGFVLDGFPRTLRQARALDGLLGDQDPLVVLVIEVPEDELVRRLQRRRICGACGQNAEAIDLSSNVTCRRCGGALVPRSDDSVEVLRARLRVYEQDTRPLVAYYRERASFRAIDGNRAPEKVHADLRAAIDSVLGGQLDETCRGMRAESRP